MQLQKEKEAAEKKQQEAADLAALQAVVQAAMEGVAPTGTGQGGGDVEEPPLKYTKFSDTMNYWKQAYFAAPVFYTEAQVLELIAEIPDEVYGVPVKAKSKKGKKATFHQWVVSPG